ncbi:MAG: ABC transporter ATP-binding protein [Planctomycetaceae bacterium]|nr:ABC transporter ATP-binding protein [Planctomycetaceae bacterium]
MLLLENVVKTYRQGDGRSLKVLDLPSYRMDAGEQVVLLGPSGCGKTTTLHVIAGIIAPDSGRVVVDGLDLTTFSQPGRDRVRANKLGYVFQTFNLLKGFTALENVILGMTFSNRKIDRQRAVELLELVGLGHRLHHKPNKMSVGEQQRTAVARALANRPKLILADEPTANVDPANQQVVVDLLRESCRRENIALLMVTHNMEVAAQFDRVDNLAQLNRAVAEAKRVVQ